MADAKAPIIVKKIKKGGHGHHGGAWKVAYADFVTAMMAFFLLLWLLSSTSEGQKDGIAEYFTPTVGLKDSMGIGFEGGEKPSKEGKSKSDLMPPGIVMGAVPPGEAPDAPEQSLVDGTTDANLFTKAEEEIKQAIESDPNLREFSENIIVEQTPEGLKLELRDDDKHPMYLPGSKDLSDFGKKILTALVPFIKRMPNMLSIIGHTDATPLGKAGYSNWELSADRANSARLYLQAQNLTEKRIGKIVGRADRELLLPEEPASPRNRRIEIILLKGSHLASMPQNQVAPRALLSAPRASDTLKKMEQRQQQKKMEIDAEQKKNEPKPASSLENNSSGSGISLKPMAKPGQGGMQQYAPPPIFKQPGVPLTIPSYGKQPAAPPAGG